FTTKPRVLAALYVYDTMKLLSQLVIAMVVGAAISGVAVWVYLHKATGEALAMHLSATPSEVRQKLLIVRQYNEGNADQAKHLAFMTLLDDHRYLQNLIASPHMPSNQKQRYIEAKDDVAEYLLKYPVQGCESSKDIEELRECFRQTI
ncbi:hypothetical protein, partial [Marinimicrobium sp. ABcell2]|uniref:hypothetical protein n=1 Tax=Marinimicrobium sp. ABcell2 TaxID=3069751 RepID=UPI0027AE825A